MHSLGYVIFRELCYGKCWELIAIYNLLKTRMNVDIVVTEKCKVPFDLKYVCIHNCFMYC